MTSEAGLAKALRAVEDTDLPVLLFGALPCTGDSPYQNISWYRSPKTRRKIRAHWAVFRALWNNFHKVATSCMSRGGQIAIEWPRACAYWRRRQVRTALKRWGCQPYKFDGCMFGLVSQQARCAGVPLKKPWTIASNCATFHRLCRKCDGTHQHVPTQGSDTRLTEGYTHDMVATIHQCWREQCEVALPG